LSRNIALTGSGDELRGPMHQEKAYFITQPSNRAIADSSKLSLDFRYARNLNFDRSLVTVSINNTPIGSKKLTSALADGDNLTLPIPKNLNISGNFSVKVAFDLEIENGSCIHNEDETPWAYIGHESLLQLNTKDRTDLLFNNYPYPFLRDGIYNQVAVVLPAERDAYMFETLSNVFNLLGRFAESNVGHVRYFDSESGSDGWADYNIIAIGTFRNNKLIREQNDNLYFKYDKQGDGIQSNEKMSIESGYGKRLGTLQLLESPFAAGHGLLVVTGAASEYYYQASKYVSSPSATWKISGDAVAADKDGNVRSFRFKNQAAPQEPSLLGEVLERGDVLGFLAAAGLVAVMILISLIFMILKYRKKRRDDRETQQNK